MMADKIIVKAINLGRMGFMEAYNLQKIHARNILDCLAGKSTKPVENVLYLVEHHPVYTIGIRTAQYSLEDEEKLKRLGAEFYRTDRGGLITFHGPGQLVAYPVINLKDFTPSVRWFICAMEKTMIGTCQHFGLEGRTTKDTGVWIGEKKISAIGVHARRYVTTHGSSINCDVDLSWYDHIVPCGLEGKEVTSLSQETGHNINIAETIQPFLDAFKKQFNCDIDYRTN